MSFLKDYSRTLNFAAMPIIARYRKNVSTQLVSNAIQKWGPLPNSTGMMRNMGSKGS